MNEPLVERRKAPAFDIGVLLEKTYRTFGKMGGNKAEMKMPVWSLRELVVRGQVEDDAVAQMSRRGLEKTVVHDSVDGHQVLWTGFLLQFHRDGGESYWHTLVGNKQELFVVCQDDEDGVFTPILVTADYDEAMAYQEADDTILSTSMPQSVYLVIERFVLENYTPVAKKRRKRKNWHGEDSDEPFARKPKTP